VAPGLGDKPEAHAFAIAMLVYCAVDGFLLGYLWTRIEVSRGLKAAAEDLAGSSVVLEEALPDAPPPLPPPPNIPNLPPAGPANAVGSNVSENVLQGQSANEDPTAEEGPSEA